MKKKTIIAAIYAAVIGVTPCPIRPAFGNFLLASGSTNPLQGVQYYGDQGRFDPNGPWQLMNQRIREVYYEGNAPKAFIAVEQAYRYAAENFGQHSREAIISQHNLAALSMEMGYYGTAEQHFKKVCPETEAFFGLTHSETIKCKNNLALLYQRQGRFEESETFFSQAGSIAEQVLGWNNEMTLRIYNNMATLMREQGRYDQAESIYQRILGPIQEIHGESHYQTLSIQNNLALLYRSQGRYVLARSLFEKILDPMKDELGAQHRLTLSAMNNFALVLHSMGELKMAEKLFAATLSGHQALWGTRHPRTLNVHLNYARLLVAIDRLEDTAIELRRIGGLLRDWTLDELTTTSKSRVRRHLVFSQADFQDTVISLAILHPTSKVSQLAADTVLRWKRLQGEEEAFIEKLVKNSDNKQIIELGKRLNNARAQLAFDYHHLKSIDRTLEELESSRLALANASRGSSNLSTLNSVGLEQVAHALSDKRVLVVIKKYRAIDFNNPSVSDWRWSGFVVHAGAQFPRILDLGKSGLAKEWLAFNNQRRTRGAIPLEDLGTIESSHSHNQVLAHKLYKQLFAPFEPVISKAETVFILPDDILHVVPLHRLVLADGRYWIQRQMIRIIHSGRDLISRVEKPSSNTLLVMGGIEFEQLPNCDNAPLYTKPQSTGAVSRSREKLLPFESLPGSLLEANSIAALFGDKFGNQAVRKWLKSDAGEGRLKRVHNPPRVFHLATHGFYLENHSSPVPPLLLSGLALAGANKGLTGSYSVDHEDGILFAIEAIGLNLAGTDLVVLSACKTGVGAIDYSEGVYGLVRAFHLANANTVLMTLWPIGDELAKDFMINLYKKWLAEPDMNIYAALRQTQLEYISREDPRLSDPDTWAPYVLVGR